MTDRPRASKLHFFVGIVVVAVMAMIALGAYVTSRDAGLSIPDPVANHGAIVPSEQLRDGYTTAAGRAYSGSDVASEFFHRVTGWTLGTLILLVAVATFRRPQSKRLRGLAVAAVALVAIQGAVGAAGVALKQPAAMAVAHGLLAQTLLALLVVLWDRTSRDAESGAPRREILKGASLRRLAVATLAAYALQLTLGAIFRHSNAGVALIAHVVVGLALLGHVAALNLRIQERAGDLAELTRPAMILGALVLVQLFLGFLAFLFRSPKNAALERSIPTILFPTLHVVTGALFVATATLLAARCARRVASAPEASAAEPAAVVSGSAASEGRA